MATVQEQATGAPGPVEKATKDLHYCQTLATDVGKEDTKRHRTAKLWMQHAEDVERKDIMKHYECSMLFSGGKTRFTNSYFT